MNFYAVVDGIRILRVVESWEPTEDSSVLLRGWSGLPPAPSSNHTLCVQDSEAVWLDLRTLEEAQDAKWEEIKIARESEIDSPLVTPFGTFSADLKSRGDIVNAVFMARTLHELSLPSDTTFTLRNNQNVVLSVAQMTTVGLLLGEKIQAAFAKGRALRQQIYATSSVAEVDAISW